MSAHLSTSLLMKAAKLSGVDPGNISSANVVILSLVSGAESNFAICAAKTSTIGRGGREF